MSDAVKIELTEEAKALIRQLGAADQTLQAVRREMDTQNQLTVDATAENRLSGVGPFDVSEHRLGERTHRLKPSLRRAEATISGHTVEGSIGSNVIYARAHEFGVDQEVTVAPHIRKRFAVEKFSGLGNRTVRRKVQKADTMVRAGKRHMRLPARAPITTGVHERIPILGSEVSRAIVESWQDKRAPA